MIIGTNSQSGRWVSNMAWSFADPRFLAKTAAIVALLILPLLPVVKYRAASSTSNFAASFDRCKLDPFSMIMIRMDTFGIDHGLPVSQVKLVALNPEFAIKNITPI
jgi:hypothetical protein